MNPEKRIKVLKTQIKKANKDYWEKNISIIPDKEYDSIRNELIFLEEKYPEYQTEDSPTLIVDEKNREELKKITHQVPMMSLSNVFNKEEIESFDEKNKKIEKEINYVLELKIDGFAVSIYYENGILVKAATRGNGIVGEDITENVKMIKDIPHQLNKSLDIEVRGEIYMSKKVFLELNVKREAKGLNPFQNPRNAAAGTIRQLDPKVVLERKLSCYIYHIPKVSNYSINSQYKALDFIRNIGLKANKKSKKVNNIEEIFKYIDHWTNKREELPYEIDGIVIKIDDINLQKKIGSTGKHPKWATSYKFPAEEIATKLEKIVFTVGRTGQITPNAVFTPVRIAGTRVSKATLHNFNFIKERDIREGDYVLIRKAGEIIPEVIKPLLERREKNLKEFKMIEDCPICGEKISKKETEVDHFCLNKTCPALEIEKLIHFASRKVMNIEGLGEQIIEDFYNLSYLRKYSDIYDLKNHQDELMILEGFGEKSIKKILEAIEKSKKNSLEYLLFGLGIKHIGEKTALILAKKFKTLDTILTVTNEELININEVGPEISASLIEYINNRKNIEEIIKLKERGLNFNFIKKSNNDNPNFTNKTFVITGTFSTLKREEIKESIEASEGKVTTIVSKKTDALILGEKPGSKYQKALDLGVEIWDEKTIREKL